MFASKDTLLTRPSGGYNIARSVRFRSSASAYLNRTFSTPTSAYTWTYSTWVKRGTLGVENCLISAGSSGTSYIYLRFETNGELYFVTENPSLYRIKTNAVYRDPSSWYHIILQVDTTQATASNRMRLYVNGVQVTSFALEAQPPQNTALLINSAIAHNIGRRAYFVDQYQDLYQTETNFIDGQALTPSSFGSTNAITGVWQPAKYTGTYGTNGFYLNFSDNSNNTAATIGKDYSGNGNNWTPNNISVTAGVTYDSMVDSPTVGATSSNYCVINPLMKYGSNLTWANGNLQVNKTSSSTQDHTYGTVGVSSGKWYWEMTVTSISGPGNTYIYYGIGRGLDLTAAYDNTAIWYTSDGTKTNRASASYNQAYGATYTAGDVIAVALDLDAGTITFYKNNTSQGVAYSNLSTYPGLYMAYIGFDGTSVTSTTEYNFGQRPFTYTPPTGFVALNTYNLPASTITNGAAYMAATLYSGTGGTISPTNTVNSVSFQPDFVWIKVRTTTYNHNLFDSVRGVQNVLNSNANYAENVSGAGDLTAFNSNGFTVRQTANYELSNASATYVAWQWKAGTTSASNTNGSITSTVSVGATQGFSVVTYTGTGANATVGHGLGVAPSFIIIKNRSSALNWICYHASLGNGNAIFLNLTNASSADTAWNNTSPTSTVFSLGSAATNANGSGNALVAYCFSAVAGYSAFGSYTGNGSANGPFVFLGFRPRWVMFKNTTTGAGWLIFDSSRNTYNLTDLYLQANQANAEAGNSTDNPLDFLSNGFKLRYSNSATNASAEVYIYAAFAENPFKNSLAR